MLASVQSLDAIRWILSGEYYGWIERNGYIVAIRN